MDFLARRLWRNPELVRHARSRLRLTGLLGYGALAGLWYAGASAVVMAERLDRGGSFLDRGAEDAFVVILVTQIVVLLTYGLLSALRSVAEGRGSGAGDLALPSPLTPVQRAVGCVFGAPVVAWYVAAIGVPFELLCVCLGGVSVGEVALAVAIAGAACVGWLSAAVIVSAFVSSVTEGMLWAAGIFVSVALLADEVYTSTAASDSLLLSALVGWVEVVEIADDLPPAMVMVWIVPVAGLMLWLAAKAVSCPKPPAASRRKALAVFAGFSALYVGLMVAAGLGTGEDLSQIQTAVILVVAILAAPSRGDLRSRAGGTVLAGLWRSGYALVACMAMVGAVAQGAALAVTVMRSPALATPRGWRFLGTGWRLAPAAWLLGMLSAGLAAVLITQIVRDRWRRRGGTLAVLLVCGMIFVWGCLASFLVNYSGSGPMPNPATLALVPAPGSPALAVAPFALPVLILALACLHWRNARRRGAAQQRATGRASGGPGDRLLARASPWTREAVSEVSVVARESLRGHWGYLALFGTLVSGGILLVSGIHGSYSRGWLDLWWMHYDPGQLVSGLAVIQYAVVLVLSPALVLRRVAAERTGRALDTLRASGRRPSAFAAGRILGAAAPAWVLALTVVPWQILTCALAHNWDLFVMCIVSAVVLVVSGILASAVALIVASVVRSEAWAALICLGLGLLAGSAADWFRPGSMSSPLEVLGGGWMAGVLLLQGGDYSEIWTVAPVYLYIAAWSAVLAGRRLLGGESRLLSGPEAAVCLAGWAVAWLPFVLPAGVPDMAANATRELEGVNTMALILLAVAVVPGRDAILAPVRSAARGVAGAISGGAYSTRQCLAWGAAATGVVVAADAARRLVTGVELSWEAAASRGIMLLALVASAILVTEFAMLVLRRFGRQAAMVAVVALAGVYVFVGEFSLGAPEVVFIFPDEVRVYEPVALVLKVAIPPVSLLVLRRLRLNFLGRLFRTAAASERGPAVEAAQ